MTVPPSGTGVNADANIYLYLLWRFWDVAPDTDGCHEGARPEIDDALTWINGGQDSRDERGK